MEQLLLKICLTCIQSMLSAIFILCNYLLNKAFIIHDKGEIKSSADFDEIGNRNGFFKRSVGYKRRVIQ